MKEHVEPEESDWDWSKSKDTNPDLKTVIVVLKEADLSMFLGDISQLIEKGFSSVQISVIIKQLGRLDVYEKYFLEYYVRAFDRGTQLQFGAERIDPIHLGLAISCDSALSFEIAQIIPKYDQRDEEEPCGGEGLN